MRMAIIGLPLSGKTTLFDALTGRHDEPGHYAAPGSVQLGAVRVADERVAFIAEVVKPKKATYAQTEFVDIGGLFTGEKASVEAVDALRSADGFVKVVRAFQDAAVPHLKGSVDPRRDLAEIDADLFVVDLDIIERRVERLRASTRKPTPKQDEEKAELALLERLSGELEAAGALSALALSDDERKRVRGFQFLTQKPGVVVVNVGDGQIADADAIVGALGEQPCPRMAICAAMEREILELEPGERGPFLEDLGLGELSEDRLVRASLEALDLITFFTANDRELRAWLIARGSSALEAAGKVHTDMARGFIRAEVVPVAELRAHGSFREVRAHGKERLEGKDYVVQDGDILNIRFSV